MTKTLDGTALVATDAANPCGLQAKSYFNDTFTLWDDQLVKQIGIDETDIAWMDDDKIFGRPANANSIQWIDPTTEHFQVWMRYAATPHFTKLWGRIN